MKRMRLSEVDGLDGLDGLDGRHRQNLPKDVMII